jgi:hypothetical protein
MDFLNKFKVNTSSAQTGLQAITTKAKEALNAVANLIKRLP